MTIAPFQDDLTKVRIRTRKHSSDGATAVGDGERREILIQLLNDVLASELIWLITLVRRALM